MLIRFSVENYKSFDKEAVFSMLPGKAQKHKEHIIKDGGEGIDALQIALIYGANASGKSNLIKAMSFARDLIVNGTRPRKPISVDTFRLVKDRSNKNSKFEFELAIGEKAYAYGFVIDKQKVHEEWLYTLTDQSESKLFERKTEDEVTRADFSEALFTDNAGEQFLQFVARGTRPNQLLLTEAAENNVAALEAIYEWFYSTLTIIFPESRYQGIPAEIDEDQEFTQALTTFLQDMNTGIDEVCLKEVELDSSDIGAELKDNILSLMDSKDSDEEESEEDNYLVLNGPHGNRYLFRPDEFDELKAFKLSTRRRLSKGGEVFFDMHEESDGTQRLFDLFPILHGAKDKVFVIDELERSLHPNLVRKYIHGFLRTNRSNQLIVTTHESTLLDLSLLRRDEIWFVEKSPSGASEVYSLEEFKPRNDLDIRKGYLHGRYGAIPVFGSSMHMKQMEG